MTTILNDYQFQTDVDPCPQCGKFPKMIIEFYEDYMMCVLVCPSHTSTYVMQSGWVRIDNKELNNNLPEFLEAELRYKYTNRQIKNHLPVLYSEPMRKCPICGHSAELKKFPEDYGQGGFGHAWGVECQSCGFNQTQRYSTYSSKDEDDEKRKAILAWNKKMIHKSL